MTTSPDVLKLESLSEFGIDLVQMEIVDLDGALRGKFLPVGKVKPDSQGAFCTIVFQLTPVDDVWVSQHSSFDNGFPDLISRPDPETVVRWNWREGTASVIYDMYDLDGSLHHLAPRSILKTIAKRFAETGFEPKFGIEFETFVMHADEELMAQGRHHEMKPLAGMHNAYRLNDAADARELGAEFMKRMHGIGVDVEAFHTELGFGAIEFALAPAGPVAAADNAARAKTYFRQLCAERGLVATFMAKWKVGESGSGGHVHQSIWKNGENAFFEPTGNCLSDVALQYGVGLIKTMPDFAVIFRPNVNSYRRFDHRSWSPENASWGYDNRSAALRAIRQPSSKAFRYEHRVPGADSNMYLTLAAMLAGGHYGLVNGLTTPGSATGNAAMDPAWERLPATLPDATARFRNSEIAKDYFGAAFVEHYAASRDIEWEHWTAWQNAQVSSFELKRYFRTV
ncbi:MAG: glutamine synthetase family protein [Hyphomicrobium sp.]|uniref:glutamine synthetase family protein n=1 Tax=Hyphomicrobium sp. TaxID=82 RepID=UPI0039E52D1D